VSLNPIMIDGTGRCGGCRVNVGGEIKFACVDGPDFDGHKVDFDELSRRNGFYREEEHSCRLGGKNNG
ncbi:MAG: sulfide/dihydroorotate dehydrogenase-like FAD/NAD-binding protein, partial [Acutalibacteraceae bacterium]|nr:sulfide/dihydroorotate dehydrogenase-like FAD/NAD-binding protein [Acutalibacteraceae bacterium]